MTNNYLELYGVQTSLKQLLYEFDMAEREGTLQAMANRMKAIGDIATATEEKINRLIYDPR